MTNNTSIPAHIINIYGDIYCPISQVSVAPLKRDGLPACACCGTLIED